MDWSNCKQSKSHTSLKTFFVFFVTISLHVRMITLYGYVICVSANDQSLLKLVW